MPRRPFAMLPAGKNHHKATEMAQGIPAAAATASYAPKMPRRPFAMFRRPVAPSPVAVSPCCSSVAPAGKSHHKATAMAQGIPAAAAMASYGRSRLPFDRLQTPKMPRRPFAMLRRPVAPSPVAVSPCCSIVAPAGKSHHKATAMAQGIPAAAAMASYGRSRLPFDRLQTPKMPRRPFAMLRRPVAPSPVAVSPCCSIVAPAGKSHHKATAMAHCLVEASRPPFPSLRSLATLPCWSFKGGSAAPGR